MNSEYALEARPETGQRRTVAVREEVVVLQPRRQIVEMTHRPTDLDQLAHHHFRLARRVLSQRRYVQFVT